MERALALDSEERHEEELQVYDELIERFSDHPDPAVRVHVCRAFRAKAITLFDNDRDAEALAVGDDLLSRFGEDTDPEIEDRVAWTMTDKAAGLFETERPDEAIAVVDELVRRFDRADDLDEEPVSDAMFDKADALRDLGRTEDALAAYGDIVERFGATTDAEIREAVQRTRTLMAALLGDLGRHDAALKLLDEHLAHLEGASPSIVADALMQKGWTLERLDAGSDAIATYDELLARYGDHDDLAEKVAYGLAHKAGALVRLERRGEAIRLYRQLVDTYGASDDPKLRWRSAEALYWAARQYDHTGSMPEALLAHDELVARYAPTPREEILEG